jgi:DNA-binding NarL/FixJ family response regulator
VNPESLTTTEEQVELLLCCGYNQKQAASILGKSYQTVKNQVAIIYAKRNIGSQTLLLLGYLKRKGVDLAALGLDK